MFRLQCASKLKQSHVRSHAMHDKRKMKLAKYKQLKLSHVMSHVIHDTSKLKLSHGTVASYKQAEVIKLQAS